MRRWLVNILTALSLLLWLAAVGWWLWAAVGDKHEFHAAGHLLTLRTTPKTL